ncbi:YceI family protein [Novosphingobium beihaiensis]|uniref:YceI family protein n=1 Tax=Novosphingobium beihaiensis TaxID=2930389 RepID=A0ABT0BLM9_9SPHN|nr:YceI family protein [Novosphingobium beihaiensis]MCJ2185865.1 YceI family protein [Novosphingobium beihaiensis]
MMKSSLNLKRIALPLAAGLAALGAGAATAGVESTKAADVAAGTYQIDPSHTSVAGRIDHLGFSTTTIRFAKSAGEFTYDPAHPEDATLSVTVDTKSLSTDWEARDNELKGPMFFNTDKFPTATFTADSLTKLDDNHARVDGELTLLGVTRPVEMDVTLRGTGKGMMGDTRAGFEAHMTIQRSDFGMKAYVPAVGDKVGLSIDAEFVKKN